MSAPGMQAERQALRARIGALIQRCADGSEDPTTRDALLGDLADYQARRVTPYGRLVRARGGLDQRLAPALPTDVFRHAAVSSHPLDEAARVFRTSGSTQEARGCHHFHELGLYDLAARTAAKHALFPDQQRMRLLLLLPSEAERPDSSLSYMAARFLKWFGNGQDVVLWKNDQLCIESLIDTLRACEQSSAPVALIGTSFAFVHALDALDGQRFALPAGSRIMQTGGFKGRSREVQADTLRTQLAVATGIPSPWIVAEYGMTELSSQLYETSLREAALGLPSGPRRLWTPGWVRVQPVDGEHLQPLQGEDIGLLRLDDCANLDSVAAIQSSDRGRRVGDGIEVLGRASGAVERGCSLAADHALSSARPPESKP